MAALQSTCEGPVRHDDVVEAERDEYVDVRRRKSGIHDGKSAAEVPPWGLALSGGGIRSATFALGLIQSLCRLGVLGRFDYLSTVSGGGYIGACLTSLLSGRPDTGLDPGNCPLVAVEDPPDPAAGDPPRLSTRHQMHHLRTHGEYLAPARKGILSRDVQRAAGNTFAGIAHHFAIFGLCLVVLVATAHAILGTFDADLSLVHPAAIGSTPGAGRGEAPSGAWDRVASVVRNWWNDGVRPILREIGEPARRSGVAGSLRAMAPPAAYGAVLGLAAILAAWRLGARRGAAPGSRAAPGVRAGLTEQDRRERRFKLVVNLFFFPVSIVLLPVVAGWRHDREYPFALFYPLACSVGMLSAALLLSRALDTFGRRGTIERRSLFDIVAGTALWGMLAAAVFPLAVVLLGASRHLDLSSLALGLLALIGSYWAVRPTEEASAGTAGRVLSALKEPAIVLAVAASVTLLSSAVSQFLIRRVYPEPGIGGAALVAGCGLLAIGILGLVDSNRTSPHYFYRDRLAEAYLRTYARVARDPDDTERQGMPLAVLRDDAALKLHDLGKDNGNGPYHILVASINLPATDELNRRTLLSDHFLFSKLFVGSDSTGYVRTSCYRGGETKLARAMTISGAALSSVAGVHTRGWRGFLLTLFNLRLGYWVENPLHHVCGRKRAPLTWWPYYLLREMTGAIDARRKRVHVSDGGHTGDNLGLLPLIKRRCGLVVVSDAECDPGYGFESFNHAVRMAFVEENVRIRIDTSPLRPHSADSAGVRRSGSGVVVGTIEYPAKGSLPESRGTLVYFKAAVPPGAPVHPVHYAQGHREFPHESTADQFFDDAQFESYRALGEFIGALDAAESSTSEIAKARLALGLRPSGGAAS